MRISLNNKMQYYFVYSKRIAVCEGVCTSMTLSTVNEKYFSLPHSCCITIIAMETALLFPKIGGEIT